jgi:hypothetical protein
MPVIVLYDNAEFQVEQVNGSPFCKEGSLTIMFGSEYSVDPRRLIDAVGFLVGFVQEKRGTFDPGQLSHLTTALIMLKEELSQLSD